jgi:peptidoglycan/xylan/chitin deacetylase (PgdA/CDA1 family)
MTSLKVRAKAMVKGGIVAAASRIPRRTEGMRCLLYHSVVSTSQRDRKQMTVPADLLARQLSYLCENGYRVESAEAAVGRLRTGEGVASRSVALTFDDGYADNQRLALPILERYGCHATIFIAADALAGKVRPIYADAYLGVTQAREMLASGLISFGCHGATHRSLRDLSDGQLRDETSGAKAWMEDALGVHVKHFAYPFGSYDSWDTRVRNAVENAGFEAAFTSIVGPNTSQTDPFLLLRSRISWAEELPSFGRLLAGGYDWYAAVQWLQARRSAYRDGAG